MQINYLDAVSSVLKLIEQSDGHSNNVSCCKTCYISLFRHLLDEGSPFSMENALEWLEASKQRLGCDSYTRYRRALYLLEHYLLFGDIDLKHQCNSEDSFYCRSGMSDSFFRLMYELEEYFSIEHDHGYFQSYSVAFKNFFKYVTSHDVTEPEAITIDILISYWNDYCLPLSLRRRQNTVCAMTALMKYLHLRGDVPECYQLALFDDNVEKLEALKISPCGEAFHPSSCLESKVEEYLHVLTESKYRESSEKLYCLDLSWYFLFLEINHLKHSAQTMDLWESVLPDYPNQKKANCSVSAHRKRTIRAFNDYLNNSLDLYTRDKKSAMSDLPEWGKDILEGFIESRKLDGMTETTINMCKSSGIRFFQYLQEHDINNPDSITPGIIRAFQNQDYHSTPESKNAYNVKLRQLLQYMSERDLVPSTLVFAVSASCAPHTQIVNILSDEMVEKIYEFRAEASSPLELRDAAIVMLGLRMGIRGIDIVNLKITDFDWQRQTVSFIQQKTRKAITLPVPTDVGNSVYKYICKGRPESADSADGYIFIRHMAPYGRFKSSTVCRNALKRILTRYGFELSPKEGFHMTRKTFATRMLRADNRLDDISNALGHARQETAEVYLERDEDKMRLCPIGFGGVIS